LLLITQDGLEKLGEMEISLELLSCGLIFFMKTPSFSANLMKQLPYSSINQFRGFLVLFKNVRISFQQIHFCSD
jgi:hypothetical protein